MPTPLLVFGATGAVGSACARHAQSLGASVTLAVRDTKKPIPGLSLEQEKAGGYKRVQADLTRPGTVTEAVKQSGAKHAFVYLTSSPGSNRAAFEALKAAGVEFVVFLSSFTVELYKPAIDNVPAQEIIPYAHAQGEAALQEVFGESGYVALRPGGFASNSLRWAGMVKAGSVKMPYPEAKFDWIVPEDIGRAGGTILVNGPSSTGGEKSVLLCGPELISQGDAVKIIGRVVGKEVAVEAISDEEAIKRMVSEGRPEHIAKYLVKTLGEGFQGAKLSQETLFASDEYKAAVENVRKYAGKATTLVEWATENKGAFE
ncbi:NmrA-like family protein [Mycena venus]|uniref:NmrA-like family protein n=1 Tax=Mycena venus TaxID=2733690 RepID=A0A8H6U3Y1_9AGAR|nr:NmrA-like family protein [Mycena venus]